MFTSSRNVAVLACVLAMLGATASATLSPIDSLDLTGAQVAQIKVKAEVGSVIALNQAMSLGQVVYPAGTELIVGENNELFIAPEDEAAAPVATGVSLNTLAEKEFTLIPVDATTGELQAYNIPSDFEVAGRGGHHGRRGGHGRGHGGGRHHGHGGVTNCYHVAKAVLAGRISLTGVAAYMANAQLRAAHWTRYDYQSAPAGSACVFGAGGIRTSSGGATYGHIGIKGRGGVIDVSVGFKLHRPFLGCYHEA